MESEERNLTAYYYSFDATGVDAIDTILEAVARAGKMYHNTADWNDTDYEPRSAVGLIQEAANEAAKYIAALAPQSQQGTEREAKDAGTEAERG